MSIIDITKKYLGSPYEFEANGTKPGEKMDCSRFIQLVMNELGINISRITTKQLKQGKEINIKDIIPGDCIYFDYGKGIEDVGLYIGNNTIIHASSNEGKVVEENISFNKNIKIIKRFYKKGQLIKIVDFYYVIIMGMELWIYFILKMQIKKLKFIY